MEKKVVTANGSINLPTEISWQGSMSENWRFFKQRYEIFIIASGNEAKDGKTKTALLLNAIGDRAIKLYNGFHFEKPEHRFEFEKVIEKFEEHFNPERNEIYERYKLFTRNQNEGESYEDCSIALRDLSRVCLIEKVSKRDTMALEIRNGKKFYGLYQIPNKWCREGKKGGDCNIACESLLDDDIRDDTACAQRIFQQEGFKYWTQWEKRCKNDNHITTEIYKCPDLIMFKTMKDGDLPTPSDVLKEKRIVSRSGMERSRFLRSVGLPWLRV